MNSFSKMFAGVAVGLLVLGVAVSPASAAALTSSQVSAIIGLLQSFGADAATIANVNASLTGSTPSAGTPAASTTYTRDLTVGSTGADVTALQTFLASKGFLTMPAGVAMGYFGPLTKSALAAYQAANGIAPAAGYFGPKTRASVAGMGPVVTPGTTPTTPGASGITTPGVEGTITVDLNPTPSSGRTVRENEKKQPIIGLKIEAKNSDLAVQRIKLNLGSQSTVYTKVFSRLYVMDGNTILAEMPMDSSTAYKEGSTYYIQITGFNFIVPKDSTKILTIAMDLHNSIKASSASGCDGTGDSCTITVDADGVRALDGAGIDQKGPSSAVSRSVTIGTLLTDSASAVVSLSPSNPDAREVIAAGGSNEDEKDEVTLFMFNVKAEKDDLLLTDAVVGVTKGGAGTADASTAYLYDGSTLVGTASVSDVAQGIATFDNIDYTLPKDVTKTFTVKMDIRTANATAVNFAGIASSTGLTIENSAGTGVTPSGSASSSELVIVRNKGAETSLVSKSVTKSATAAQNNYSTTTATASFTVKVKAVGGDVHIGNTASSYPLVNANAASHFKIYRNGAHDATLNANSTSTSYNLPSVITVTSNNGVLSEGSEADITASYTFEARTPAGVAFTVGNYSVGLEALSWYNAGAAGYASSTYMAGKTAWRTSDVSLP